MSEYAAFSPGSDSVAVYESPTGQEIGVPVPLPVDSANADQIDTWTVVGLVGDTVYLSGFAPELATPPPTMDTRVAIANVSTGTFTLLCAGPQLGTTPACYTGGLAPGSYYTVKNMGSQWMTVLFGSSLRLLHYTAADGTFSASPPTSAQEQSWTELEHRAELRSDTLDQINFDTAVPTMDPGFDYAATTKLDFKADYRVPRSQIRRDGDTAAGLIDMPRIGNLLNNSQWQSQRGYCMQSGATLAVWVASTRTVWERRVSGLYESVECTNNTVTYAFSSVSAPGVLGEPLSVYAWPTATAPAGWHKVGTLAPGRLLTVPIAASPTAS